MYCSVNRRRGRMNDQAWKIRGGREGSIERVRQWRRCACRSPPFSARNPPGEGRIVTRGVRHAQHRLLNFRGYDARNNGAARSGFPSSLGCDPRKGRLVTESRLRVAGAPRCALRCPLSRVLVLLGGCRVTGCHCELFSEKIQKSTKIELARAKNLDLSEDEPKIGKDGHPGGLEPPSRRIVAQPFPKSDRAAI